MKQLFFSLLVVGLITSYGFTTVDTTTQVKRNIGEFSSIAVSGSFTVNLIPGNPGEITLEGENLDRVITKVKDGELNIRREKKKRWSWNNYGRVTLNIPVNQLEKIKLSGSGKLNSSHQITSKDLKIELSGSGKIDLNLKSDSLNGAISGSANINLKGESQKTSFSISGSGSINASSLKALESKVRISGSGRVAVHASEKADFSVSGSGRVICYGNPTVINQNTSGSARISFRESDDSSGDSK